MIFDSPPTEVGGSKNPERRVKMKFTKLLVIFLVLSMLLVSCGGNGYGTVATKPDGTTVVPDLTTDPIVPPNSKYVNYDTRMERFYIDRPVETNLSAQIDDYAKGGTASEEYISLYNQADSTRIIPIYGRYLEYSSLVCCAFLKGDKIVGSRCLVVCYENGGINVKEIHQVLTEYDDKRTYPESIYSYLKEALDSTDLADFNVIGIKYTVPGARGSDLIKTLIGTCGNDENLKYLHGLFISPFSNVEPFKTIEEGQALFEEYLKNINN